MKNFVFDSNPQRNRADYEARGRAPLRTRHTQDSHGQMPALGLQVKVVVTVYVVPSSIQQVMQYMVARLFNTAHTRQSRPDSGLGFQVKFVITVQVVPSSMEQIMQHMVARLCNTAHTRQSRPDFGLGFQLKVHKIVIVVPSSMEQFMKHMVARLFRRGTQKTVTARFRPWLSAKSP